MIRKSFFVSLCIIWFSSDTFVYTDEVMSVTEGESVTLNTDIKLSGQIEEIVWTHKINNLDNIIAEIKGKNINIYPNVVYGDRLQMDNHTGSLTIRNITTEHSGLYKLLIRNDRALSQKTFTVTVYAHLPFPVISRNCSLSSSSSSERSSVSRLSVLCSVLNVSAVSLSWYKGNSVLSNISVSNLSISLSLPLEVEYQDNNTYSCVVNNPITNRTTHLNTSQTCQERSEPLQNSHLVGITVSVILVLVVSSAVLIYFHQRKCKSVQTCDEEVLYAETTFHARRVHKAVRFSVCCESVSLQKPLLLPQMLRIKSLALADVTKQF
ncbi:SLAM family member isoform X1 [Danio rerio]|uniref:SLAM family member isoform X1 n=1 Tax=Danio rerio TaxID=7955 RepID=A0AC58IEF7_DANRE